jgi:putative transposase
MTHSYKMHFFHCIWSTKNREKWISKEVQPHLYSYIGGIIHNCDGNLIEIGGMPDHVHLLIYLNNLDNYSYLIRDIKSSSTAWVNKNFDLQSKFSWQQGYASLSVSLSSIEKIKTYIQNQETHHKKMTFEEEYLTILKRQKIQFDERFIFG